jgi:long-subunit fatty acid transport protein
MLFDFTNQAQGISVDDLPDQTPFSSSLAWETYLIDEDTTSEVSYLTQPRYEEYFTGVQQKYNVDESGSMGDLYLNSAVAIQEKVFIGLTVGFTFGNFNQKTTYKESTINDSLLLDYFVYKYDQKSSIFGVNLKVGLIYKPEDWLRLGLAYHIPNQLQIIDDWSTTLTSQFKDGLFYSDKSPEGTIEYAIKKPGKLVFSAALIAGFRGLISIDVDWINYGSSKIISNEFNFSSENQFISQVLRNTVNVRVGGEMWFGKYNIRAGYAFRQNPYKSLTSDIPEFFNTFALGAGVLTRAKVYVNLSGNYKSGYRKQSAYSPAIAEIEQVNEYLVEILVSVGYRF